MRSLKLFIMLLLCTDLFAGKLIFSNNNAQVDITGDVIIDNQEGDVTVTTEGGDYLIIGDNQPVILGFYPDDYELLSGEDVQANWTVVNADSCNASTVSGSSSWTGLKSSIDGNNLEANVEINQLPTTLSLACSNNSGTVTKSFQLVAQAVTNPGTPTIDTFTVNGEPSFVTVTSQSNLAQFVWATSDVASCTASSSPTLTGWTGSKPVNGSQNITITADTVVTLTCDNAPPKSITINHSNGVDPSCQSVSFPVLSPNKKEMTYAAANDGFLFGGSTGSKVVEAFRTDQFLALSNFYTNNTEYRRRVDFFPAPTDQRPTYVVTYSVSECPGDFGQSVVCTGVLFGASTGQINFSTRSSDIGNSNYCNLEVGKEYYFNFVHDQDPNDNSIAPRCGFPQDQSCAINATEISN